MAGAVATAIRSRLESAEGADVVFQRPAAPSLGPGNQKTFSISVTASAPGQPATRGTVEVQVKNVSLPRQPDSELWYSNNPEIIRGAGSLFAATLRYDHPARLLYHHVNASTQPLYIRVQAINPSDKPARVLIIPGDSAPTRNPVIAGMAAGGQYFRSWATGSGEIVEIPPKSTLPISLRRLGPSETASGLCGLRLLEGSPELLVRTDAWPPFNLANKWRGAVNSSTPWREVGCPQINAFDEAPYEMSEHVFPNPQKNETLAYEVGRRYGSIRIGQRAIVRQDSGKQLDGNFGVIYNVDTTIKNPTNEPTYVEVAFEASAGYSGGLFLLNGNMVKVAPIKPKTEARLAKLFLAKGSTRHFSLITIPLSGSSYPATITVRPVSAPSSRPLRLSARNK